MGIYKPGEHQLLALCLGAYLFRTNSDLKPLIYSTVHLKLATLIEYLGYIPDYIDIAKRELPLVDPSLHAGIVSWTNMGGFYSPSVINWLEASLGTVPQLVVGELPQFS
jgi:hypothetical protein